MSKSLQRQCRLEVNEILGYDPPAPGTGETASRAWVADSRGTAVEYQFRPIGKKCAATGQELAPGELCHSVVVERDGELVRLDYSEQGWKGLPEGALGVWTCVVPKPAFVRREPLDTTVLMSCFEQLIEEASPAREGLRYILALFLVKKRRLRLEGARTDGDDEYLQLAGAQGEGAYEVRDLNPTDEEVQQWQRELNVYLASEWS
jgi:hypothetical protein